MRGVYPEGFPDWEIAEIEKFRDSNAALYEWRKTAHLLPMSMDRPIGRAIPVPLPAPAKGGVKLPAAREWTPACAGEGKRS